MIAPEMSKKAVAGIGCLKQPMLIFLTNELSYRREPRGPPERKGECAFWI